MDLKSELAIGGFVLLWKCGLYWIHINVYDRAWKYWPLAEKSIPLAFLATYMQGNMSPGQFFYVLFDWNVEYRCCPNIAQLWLPKIAVLISVPKIKKKYYKGYTISSPNFVKYTWSNSQNLTNYVPYYLPWNTSLSFFYLCWIMTMARKRMLIRDWRKIRPKHIKSQFRN